MILILNLIIIIIWILILFFKLTGVIFLAILLLILIFVIWNRMHFFCFMADVAYFLSILYRDCLEIDWRLVFGCLLARLLGVV